MNMDRRNATMVDMVYESIRKDISEEALKPTQKLNARILAERYGVSVTPVKQALNRLMMQGLVENEPHKGMRVKKMGPGEVEDSMFIRVSLELSFLPTVIKVVNNNVEIQKMFEENIESHIQLVKTFSNTDEYFHCYELDQQFHRLLVQSSGNSKVLQVFDILNTHAYATYLYNKQPRERTLSGVMEHKRIYQAMREDNEEKARSLIKLHTDNAIEIIDLILKLGNT